MSTFQPEVPVRLLSDESEQSALPLLRRLSGSLKQLMISRAAAASPVLLCQSPACDYLRRWLEHILFRVAIIVLVKIPSDGPLAPAGVVR